MELPGGKEARFRWAQCSGLANIRWHPHSVSEVHHLVNDHSPLDRPIFRRLFQPWLAATGLARALASWFPGFPETFLYDCRTCFRQIFRIYAHLYHSHLVDPFWHLSGSLAKLGEFQHHPDVSGSGASITRRVTTPISAKPQVKQEHSSRRRRRRASPSVASEDGDEIQLPSTVPKTDGPLVRRLITAMIDPSAAEDNEGMKKTWEKLA